MPRVSIGIPVYNAERFLARALDSLLAQDYKDFELIISDNASTDGTPAICRQYAASDPRIRYSCNAANIGAAANFNRVFSLSRGEYFAWAAYDDSWAPSFLRRCIAALDARADAVLAHTWVRVEDFDGNELPQQARDFLDERASLVERFRACVQDHWAPLAVYGLMRASALRQTRLLKPFMGSDAVLLAELSMHGRFVQVRDPLWTYRTAGFAQGAPYIERIRTALALQRRILPTLFPWLLLASEYLRVALAADLPASDKARLVGTVLRWYGVDSLALPRVRAAALEVLGAERFESIRGKLREMPWYRRFRRIDC